MTARDKKKSKQPLSRYPKCMRNRKYYVPEEYGALVVRYGPDRRLRALPGEALAGRNANRILRREERARASSSSPAGLLRLANPSTSPGHALTYCEARVAAPSTEFMPALWLAASLNPEERGRTCCPCRGRKLLVAGAAWASPVLWACADSEPPSHARGGKAIAPASKVLFSMCVSLRVHTFTSFNVYFHVHVSLKVFRYIYPYSNIDAPVSMYLPICTRL